MFLLRKIVWSTRLRSALTFMLARTVWLGAGVCWKTAARFLTTQYYPQKRWSHHSLSSQAAQDSSQGSFQNVPRSWWLTSPRATTRSFCPWLRSNVSVSCWIRLSSKVNLGTKWTSQHLQRALMSLTPSTHPFLLLLGFLFNSSEFLNHPRLWALKTLIIDHLEELSPKVLLKPYLLTVTSYHYLWDTDSSVRSTPTRSCGWLGTAETGCRAGTLSSMAVMKPVCCCGHEFPAVRPITWVALSFPITNTFGQLLQLLIIVKKKCLWLFRAPIPIGYWNMKGGVVSISLLSQMTWTVIFEKKFF